MKETRLRRLAAIAASVVPNRLVMGPALRPRLLSPRPTRRAQDILVKLCGNPRDDVGLLPLFVAAPFIVLGVSLKQTALHAQLRR
jgi:hypothetical protein